MEIYNIKTVPDAILEKLTTLMNRDCQPGKFSLVEIRDKYSKNTDVLYIIEKGEPVYFLLLDRFPKHKSVYIHDVCVSKTARGQGLFKRSLGFLKTYYTERGFTHFTLDASDSTKEAGLDQKARLRIFSGAGFHINTETGYYTADGGYEIVATTVLLSNGETATILGRVGDDYRVASGSASASGSGEKKQYTVSINQIEKCFDGADNQISCPMIMMLPTAAGGKSRSKRRSKRQTLKKRI
jgi:hypothetical protein